MTKDRGNIDTSVLEPEQRSAALRQPLPRARLGLLAMVALWILRIYSIAAVGLVVYVFVKTLRG